MIGFVRHGITEWNKEGRTQGKVDVSLNEEGIQMSEKLAKRLRAENWALIYTSPLRRAEETARLIAKQHEVKIIVDKRLREIGEGKKEGTTEEERIAKWGKAWKALDLKIEANHRVINRAMSFISDVKIHHPNEKILVVSHGSFIQRVLEIVCPTDNFQEDIQNTSLTVVTIEDENRCHLYNCTKHLN